MKKKLFFLFNILLYSYCFADDLNLENEELKSALNHNNYEPNYFTLLVGLFLVIFLIYITGYVYQKLTKIKIHTKDDETNKPIILSTTSLGQGKNIHIIKINDEYMLIGATQNNITFLKNLDKKFYIESLEKTNENS